MCGFIIMIMIYFVCVKEVFGDNSPSLSSTNATIGIVLDRKYLGDDYSIVKDSIEKYLVFAKREILKHGGINVQYFSWTSINIKRDYTAILSVASCEDTWKLFRAALDENVLFMSISEPDCPRLPINLAITVPLLQNGEEFPQLLLDLRSGNAYNWLSAIVLFDKSLDRDMVTRVATSLTGHNTVSSGSTSSGMALSLMKLSNQTMEFQQRKEVSKILKKLSPKLGGNFLVIVSFQYVNAIMEEAKNFGLVNPYNQWLYVISDTTGNRNDISSFSNLIGEGDNVAFVYNITADSADCTRGIQCHSEELLEAFIKTLEGAILEEISVSSQVSDEEWEAIRPTKEERREYLLQGVKSHMATSGSCNNCTRWQLKSGDIWGKSYMSNATSDLLQVGFWRPSDGLTVTDELFPHVKHKFRGRSLPFITYQNPPWQILTVNSSGKVIEHKGLVFDIIDELANRLNFTYTLTLCKTNSNEMNVSDKETSSMIEITNIFPEEIIEAVRSKKSLLGACAFTVTEEKKEIINFTIPISIQSHAFLVARPRKLSRVLLFISPFTYDTWLCLSLAVVLMGPVLYLINRFSPVYQYKRTVVKGLENVQSCMWYMYGALLQQGGMYLPEVDSARLVVGTWWLVVLVVVTTYCGNLVAFLTFPKIDIPIRTIDNLLEHRETVTWGLIKGTYLEDYLKESEEPRFQTIYKGAMFYDDISLEMVEEIKERTHVFIGWKTKIAYIMKKNFIETGACDFAFGEDEFLDEKLAMIVSQDNPYLPIINDEITRLHQVGLIEKWLKDYLPTRDKCWKVGHVTEVSNHIVNIDDMQGCFFVLFIGFAVAGLVILIEKYWNYLKLKKEQTLITPFVS